MKHVKLAWTIAALVALSVGVTSQTPSGHALFEQALAKERVEGNLQEAIRLYERVVTEFKSDRALSAQALVQVGRCYEKLGREEAVRAYERLVRDFADQEDAVEQARARLVALKRSSPGAAAAATMGVRAFPRIDNLNLVLSLAPDGTKAAFGNADKGQNIGVFDVASQRTTLITDHDWTAASFYAFSPSWSPDGRRIAYGQCNLQGTACELRVASLAGQSELIVRDELGTGIIPGGWLPDGSALVVTLVRTDRTATIALVPSAGGPHTPLRSLNGWVGRYPESPSVSPDGRLIAFSEGSPGMRDIHVISRDGRTAHRITDHPADDHQPLWSPDGRHLAFKSNRNGSAALWTVAIKDGQPAAEPMRVKDGMEGAGLVGWTTRGLVYSEPVQTDDIFLVPVDPASGEPNGSPRQIPYRRTGRNTGPVWSPDGKYLAFVSSSPAEPDRRTLVLLPSGGGEPREFPVPASQALYDVRWFGDGSGLGFSGYDARGAVALFRLSLATSEWKTFPLPVTNLTRIEWNAEGSRYYYARQDFKPGDPAIVERDVHSDRERVLFQGNVNGLDMYRGLRFSPDRRLLAFRGVRDQQGIVVLDLETGQARVVHDKAAADTYTYTAADSIAVPTWSPNGRALLVNRTENPRTDKQATVLRLIPLDGSEVRRVPLGAELTRLLSAGRGTERPTLRDIVWSPDGTRLGFVLSARRLETWVIENPLAAAGAPGAARR